jgi:hypothetical protein
MSEFTPEPARIPEPPRKRSSGLAIAVIIALTVVTLACIAASTLVVYLFLLNPPW